MIQQFKAIISNLKNLPYVNRVNVALNLTRLEDKTGITNTDNLTDHFCSFFVPVYLPTMEIFVGHHIKANEWIPPGGHIEPGELPVDTVRREFIEELQFKLTDEKIELFDMDLMHIKKSITRPCKIHRDFWFYVLMAEKLDYIYDKGEFHDAGWLPINEAMNKAFRPEIITHLTNLKNILTLISKPR